MVADGLTNRQIAGQLGIEERSAEGHVERIRKRLGVGMRSADIDAVHRRGVALTPMETRYDLILRTAQLADELGYEAFALPEGWGLDATLLLTEAASRTRRINLVAAAPGAPWPA